MIILEIDLKPGCLYLTLAMMRLLVMLVVVSVTTVAICGGGITFDGCKKQTVRLPDECDSRSYRVYVSAFKYARNNQVKSDFYQSHASNESHRGAVSRTRALFARSHLRLTEFWCGSFSKQIHDSRSWNKNTPSLLLCF